MRVSNVNVYGLEDSIRGAKLPMAVDPGKLTGKLTDGIRALAVSKPGSGHDQWLTGVIVQFDLNAPLKMWTEMQRYHFVDFVSSQSTMHRICRFDFDAQCNDYVDSRIKSVVNELICEYNERNDANSYLRVLYNVPAGFCLTARLTTNYRQLKTIYAQRKNHRLPDWREFCLWVETLPHSELITGGETDDEG